jgi:peptide/nickel transport system permease protein
VSLARYAAFRIAVIIPVIALMLTLTFLITHVLPANPAVEAAGPYPTHAMILEKERQLGLNHSVLVQLGDYFSNLVHGDLGRSIVTGDSVAQDLLNRVPSTLELITLGLLVGTVLAVGVAVWSAEKERGPAAFVARVYGGFGSSVPDFFLGVMLILIFYAVLNIAPAPLGQSSPRSAPVPHWSGAYLIDGIRAGNLSAVGSALGHLVLPVMTLALAYSAPIYRVARAAIEDARRARYVDYLELMGASRRLVWRSVLENSAPPALTIIGVLYGLMLGGAVIVETVFSWGGVGQYAVTSIDNNDFFAIQGFVLVAGVFSVLIYFVVDLLHATLDPRVRRAA